MLISEFDNAFREIQYPNTVGIAKDEASVLLKEYRDATAKLDYEFKEALYKELDIADNPKRELLFAKAWELGHANGYYEVFNVASDLVGLIQ